MSVGLVEVVFLILRLAKFDDADGWALDQSDGRTVDFWRG
jgi:hypothetical protein